MAPEFNKLSDITAASCKVYFGIAPSDTSKDAMIASHLLRVISYWVEKCEHDFDQTADRTEKPIIMPYEKAFYVSEYPVVSITSLTESDGNNTILLAEGKDYYCDYQTGRVEKIDIPLNIVNPDRWTSAYWSQVRNAVTIIYKGGVAVNDNIIGLVKEMVGISCGLKKRTYVDNQGITQVATLTSLPSDMKEMFEHYERKLTGHR